MACYSTVSATIWSSWKRTRLSKVRQPDSTVNTRKRERGLWLCSRFFSLVRYYLNTLHLVLESLMLHNQESHRGGEPWYTRYYCQICHT
jgi:hypothetical protein